MGKRKFRAWRLTGVRENNPQTQLRIFMEYFLVGGSDVLAKDVGVWEASKMVIKLWHFSHPLTKIVVDCRLRSYIELNPC